MSSTIGIIDLFAGPGGLGEGFSAFRNRCGEHPFSIEISVEKDTAAHATLRLRSFLRKFGDNYPAEYFEFLNGRLDEPDWSQLYPDQWAAAENEARHMELGAEGTGHFLSSRIAEIIKVYGDRTVLIGGPPCQAYSIVGRSRNVGKTDYLAHKDERNFLYEKYVDVLRQLKPAAFVMENVKGMLSSAIKGDPIFLRVMADLRSAAGTDSYKLVALSPEKPSTKFDSGPAPADFVVRMENHGVPQARHRVIIIGLRQDIACGLTDDLLPRLPHLNVPITVGDVIGTMPRLRSGLSRNDNFAAWQDIVLNAIDNLSGKVNSMPQLSRDAFKASLTNSRSVLTSSSGLSRTSGRGVGVPTTGTTQLRHWLIDPNLERLPNNETRGHMPSDLERYMFAATFCHVARRSPLAPEFPAALAPNHQNWGSGKFKDRFRVQIATRPGSTVTSHISKDGHYFIHPDPSQCRSLTVREAARLQTFPDNYLFKGNRTEQYVQVGNAVPPFLAMQIAESLWKIIAAIDRGKKNSRDLPIQKLIESSWPQMT